LGDFIFQGMAISLLFGALISTLLTLLVIPLGCVSAQRAFVMPKAPYPHSIQVTATPPITLPSKPTLPPTSAPLTEPPVTLEAAPATTTPVGEATQEAAPAATTPPGEATEEEAAANKKEAAGRRGIRLKPPQGEASSTGEGN
jgi:hypothetical protein